MSNNPAPVEFDPSAVSIAELAPELQRLPELFAEETLELIAEIVQGPAAAVFDDYGLYDSVGERAFWALECVADWVFSDILEESESFIEEGLSEFCEFPEWKLNEETFHGFTQRVARAGAAVSFGSVLGGVVAAFQESTVWALGECGFSEELAERAAQIVAAEIGAGNDSLSFLDALNRAAA